MAMNSLEIRSLGVIPMTPDKTVEWRSYAIESLDSRLYVHPGYSSAAAELALQSLLNVAQHGTEGQSGLIEINRGANCIAFKDNDIVIKQPLRRYTSDAACGLAATQAIVTLGEGLRRLSWHRFDTARPYACLVAGPDSPGQTLSTMMMSYAKGSTPTTATPLPSSKKRQKLYDTATQLCGAEKGDIYYDDSLDNLKVRTIGGIIYRITKLDIWPLPNFIDKMGERPPRFFC